MQFSELHLGIGKHPTTISSSLFYHCEALGLSSDRPEYALAWIQLCYSGSKLVQGLQIRCYLDSTLLGMSGFFTPPEARPSRPAHLQPEVAELGGTQEKRRTRRTRRTRRSRVKLAQNAARIFNWRREGPLSGWQSVWPIWRESRPKCRHRTVAEGGCKWWMEVVRCSNCVQVIDPPPFFSLPSSWTAHTISALLVPYTPKKTSAEKCQLRIMAAHLFGIFKLCGCGFPLCSWN